ncbi:hypothetical protein L195_g053844 [Trifolium pratense]|uniref:Uncharacterized protein n=1 Tax=Trifolium pratense TaxID=57577 RepID=A0A2K3KCU3_TRIPR|nr:hypothetical protein L195_g053844 [Trifolium pratense]
MQDGEATKDGVGGVPGDLAHGGLTDQALRICESDARGGGPVAMFVGDDFDTVVLPHSNAGVGGAKVDSNREALSVSSHQ